MVREEGGSSSKVISSPSSKAQSLPTEKNMPDRVFPIVVWNQILQFALSIKIEETRYNFHVILLLIWYQSYSSRSV